MTPENGVVFLLDVDNTLLDNDHIREDMQAFLRREFGTAGERYWALQERLFVELGYRDYLGALGLVCDVWEYWYGTCSAGEIPAQAPASEWQTYTNAPVGYSLQVPTGWGEQMLLDQNEGAIQGWLTPGRKALWRSTGG